MFDNQIVGIDIGSFYTKVVTGNWNGKKMIMEKEIMLPTPEEAYVDGYFKDPKMVEGFLNEILSSNKIKKASVVFTVDSSEIIMREMVMPWAAEKDLRNMLPFEIEKNFPVKGLNYVSEYQVIEDYEDEGTRKVRLQVAIMPSTLVEQYWNMANNLKLKPLALEIQPASIAKIFENKLMEQPDLEGNGYTVALIDGGYSKTRFTIVNSGKIEFSRVFLRGSKELDETLASVLDVSKEEAREQKKKGSLVENNDPDVQQDLRINRALQVKVDEWLVEIQPNIRYYLSLKEGNKIDKIIIYGGLGEINGIKEYAQEFFNYPADIFNDVDFVAKKKGEKPVDINLSINAITSIIQG